MPSIRLFAAVLMLISGGCASNGANDSKATGPATAPPPGAPPTSITVEVIVSGVTPGRGEIRCALYDSAATFMTRDGIFLGKSVPASAETIRVSFDDVARDRVAVMVFQDVNSNEKLDRGDFGLPAEPWGTSGVRKSIGAPKWSECSVALKPGMNALPVALIQIPTKP